MAATLSPIKIDPQTDDLVSQTAHFLSKSKKDIVDRAVREYIDNHREEINAGVKSALAKLDGTEASAVAVLAGLSVDELDDLGGMPE